MKTNWNIISASVTGKGHLETGVPCQDANSWKMINEYFGIAVTADGAGSYENSQLGSAFVVENIIEILTNEIREEIWFKDHSLPTEEEWREVALKGIEITCDNLVNYSKDLGIDAHSTGCTLNIALFSKEGILSAHIGDGRACYQNENNEWKAMLIPFKGNEVGSTVFITTDWLWEDTNKYIETRVIRERIMSFALLSDGMESLSYLCNTKDENEQYSDPNKPFEKFFNTNISAINDMIKHGKNLDEINQLWSEYLTSGKNLSEENDDKTMLIGIFIDR